MTFLHLKRMLLGALTVAGTTMFFYGIAEADSPQCQLGCAAVTAYKATNTATGDCVYFGASQAVNSSFSPTGDATKVAKTAVMAPLIDQWSVGRDATKPCNACSVDCTMSAGKTGNVEAVGTPDDGCVKGQVVQLECVSKS